MAAAKANLDHLGWAYIGITLAWTTILVAVMGFLWYHRKLPHLQMRRLPLVFTAITLLHLYAGTCSAGYVIISILPCSVEFWLMNFLVPFGIAIFQVANTQFLYIASQQKRYTSVQSLEELVRGKKVSALDGQTGGVWQRTVGRLKQFDQITRMVIFVAIGMAVQAALTILIFLLSRKFHPSFGVLPEDLGHTDSETRMNCSRGWEWWLSIVWQFFWAWLYAPYILWSSRHIKDTHGWRFQTILCCIAGLPCSPLWLASLYSSAFAPVNAVFIPPLWFSASIFFIECFTLLIPCYQVYKHHNLRDETLAAIANWEKKNKASGSLDSDSTKVGSQSQLSFKTVNESQRSLHHKKSFVSSLDGRGSVSSRKSHMYTMLALEHALKCNAEPLQKFAALRDFSGENISFLTHLASWKQVWPKEEGDKESDKHEKQDRSEQLLRAQFNKAIRIYAAFVSSEHAEFPINISYKVQAQLDNMFAGPAELLYGDTRSESTFNSAIPFDDNTTSGAKVGVESPMPRASNDSARSNEVWYWGEIPPEFSRNAFDDSEGEIKYLILTNTWPKFVNAGYAEQIQIQEEEEGQGTGFSYRMSQFFYRH